VVVLWRPDLIRLTRLRGLPWLCRSGSRHRLRVRHEPGRDDADGRSARCRSEAGALFCRLLVRRERTNIEGRMTCGDPPAVPVRRVCYSALRSMGSFMNAATTGGNRDDLPDNISQDVEVVRWRIRA